MNEQEKQAYLERYDEQKKKGVPFFPDILFKDAIVSLIVFLILVALAYFIGAPLEERADPADTSYTPRPEWYFIFLFQLLKYFPPSLEVIGVVVIPTLVVILLFLLPLLDRSPRRHPSGRLVVIGFTFLIVAGVFILDLLAYLETPPPAEAVGGDRTAALYAKNCAPCHGPSITVPPGTNLHDVIAQGSHEGMPAWSGDLTTDEIDALAGFVLSPGGSQLFTKNCGTCHEVTELVASDPLELKTALDEGPDYSPHEDVDVPSWKEVLDPNQRTTLLNFLVAPDGQRLFNINCAPCHGQAVSFTGDTSELNALISSGGMHLEMPPWRERLNEVELNTLADYVTDPSSTPEGVALFSQYCADCHGERIPASESMEQAKEVIAGGGPHETMPVWGDILTSEQIAALVDYTLEAARGTPLQEGQQLFAQNCAPCHGALGEGGPNPARPDDIIAPISTAEYLTTRDDHTLRNIISQGQPNFGMSPFGTEFGGPLDDDQINALVAYMRSWEQNPPVEAPPQVAASSAVSLSGEEIYNGICLQCHGPAGEGRIGPSLRDPKFQDEYSDQDIFDSINTGHKATAMIGWGEILNSEQIEQLVGYIRQLRQEEAEKPTDTPLAGQPTFTADVLPIFEDECKICHGSLGGWDSSSYEAVMTTGNNAPVVIPGDVENSLLAQKMLGTHTEGAIMPPTGKLSDDVIQIILDWIEGGAPE